MVQIFRRNIEERCKELHLINLANRRNNSQLPIDQFELPKTALNPFKDEKQAIATYCEQQGLTPDQRQVIDKLEKLHPGFIAFVFARGAVQTHFRTALLFAFDRKCAFCDFAVEEGLEAAHIVPWVKCNNDEERRDSANGFLLCATHHRLFDRGRLKALAAPFH